MSRGNGREGEERFVRGEVLRTLERLDLRVDFCVRDKAGHDVTEAAAALVADVVHREDRELQRRESLAAMAEFGAGVIHDVKNLLAAAGSFAQVGKQRTSDEASKRLFAQIEEQLQRCTRVLAQFLEVVRAREPLAQSAREHISIADLIDQAVALVSWQLGLHGIGLEVRIADDLPSITASRDDLIQVLLNVLLNAVHAAAEQPGDERRIVLSATANPPWVTISLVNSGRPIPNELCDQIFEPFFTTKPVGVGTGIGLAMARRLLEEHEGTLDVVRGRSEGAEFIVQLPAGSSD